MDVGLRARDAASSLFLPSTCLSSVDSASEMVVVGVDVSFWFTGELPTDTDSVSRGLDERDCGREDERLMMLGVGVFATGCLSIIFSGGLV